MKQFRYNGKINVAFTYYLNKQLKPDNKGAYPVYIRINYKRNNNRVRSSIDRYLHHIDEIEAFKETTEKEIEKLFNIICENWENTKFHLRELSHKPRASKQIGFTEIIEFFKAKHGLSLNNNEVYEIVKTVRLLDTKKLPKPQTISNDILTKVKFATS